MGRSVHGSNYTRMRKSLESALSATQDILCFLAWDSCGRTRQRGSVSCVMNRECLYESLLLYVLKADSWKWTSANTGQVLFRLYFLQSLSKYIKRYLLVPDPQQGTPTWSWLSPAFYFWLIKTVKKKTSQGKRSRVWSPPGVFLKN